MDIKQARKNVIEQQIRPWGGLNIRANQALIDIPRENFVPEEYQNLVFADMEIPLTNSEKMLSPKIEGRILDSLDLKGHEDVLEIGTGSGYFTAVLASLAKSVKSIEIHKELIDAAKEKIDVLNISNVELVNEDALNLNLGNEKFDTIVVGCSLPVISEDLKRALKISGKLFIVVGSKNQMHATLVERIDGDKWKSKSLFETYIDLMNGSEPLPEFTF
ncbi:protein-L-isoaspartate O-methyltransferase [Candidatus Thioglobus sp. NP1]|uniref:protein-L-isoaspartate O-methyltransferase family protein n=1 Tax=Candidatus Thioglobus sp. NP1 TaxID=2508687 RepID=UPI000DEDA553|nr:protein-L-isoaspartate O-methyltransferase [Candidatus Thioglobus sp. NP1]AXE61585.1 protein-L-isoaspartate(D-aspartate) O-methyltransferase [Candidatus Thioglobus sp. NP1]